MYHEATPDRHERKCCKSNLIEIDMNGKKELAAALDNKLGLIRLMVMI